MWLRSLSANDLLRLEIKTDAEWLKFLGGLHGIDVSETVGEMAPSLLAESQPFEHPFYWAAFILIGAPE